MIAQAQVRMYVLYLLLYVRYYVRTFNSAMRASAIVCCLPLMAAWIAVRATTCLWAQLPPTSTREYRRGSNRESTWCRHNIRTYIVMLTAKKQLPQSIWCTVQCHWRVDVYSSGTCWACAYKPHHTVLCCMPEEPGTQGHQAAERECDQRCSLS